jgi:hypothetical protein
MRMDRLRFTSQPGILTLLPVIFAVHDLGIWAILLNAKNPRSGHYGESSCVSKGAWEARSQCARTALARKRQQPTCVIRAALHAVTDEARCWALAVPIPGRSPATPPSAAASGYGESASA